MKPTVLPIALAFIALLACATAPAPMYPRSANPYQPDPGPSSEGAAVQAPNGAPAIAPMLAGSVVVAVAASVNRRVEGDCFVPCLKGTTCNKETGLCDTLPCRGECKSNERCDQSGFIAQCVPIGGPDLQIERDQTAPVADAPLR